MGKALLGPIASVVKGRIGNTVFVEMPNVGTVMRQWVYPSDPRTPAQIAFRDRVTQAARAFKALSSSEHSQWIAYAKHVAELRRLRGESGAPQPINVFIPLATKILQMNSTAEIPRTPPTSDFLGDTVVMRANGISGNVRFTASCPNGPSATTELLLQPLKSANRTPMPTFYRHQAFAAFTESSLYYDIPLKPGYYAAAIRFVHSVTGQVSDLVQLGTVEVTS